MSLPAIPSSFCTLQQGWLSRYYLAHLRPENPTAAPSYFEAPPCKAFEHVPGDHTLHRGGNDFLQDCSNRVNICRHVGRIRTSRAPPCWQVIVSYEVITWQPRGHQEVRMVPNESTPACNTRLKLHEDSAIYAKGRGWIAQLLPAYVLEG